MLAWFFFFFFGVHHARVCSLELLVRSLLFQLKYRESRCGWTKQLIKSRIHFCGLLLLKISLPLAMKLYISNAQLTLWFFPNWKTHHGAATAAVYFIQNCTWGHARFYKQLCRFANIIPCSWLLKGAYYHRSTLLESFWEHCESLASGLRKMYSFQRAIERSEEVRTLADGS